MANDLLAGAHPVLDWTAWWTQADMLVQALACGLLLMSIASWTVICVLWRQRTRKCKPIGGEGFTHQIHLLDRRMEQAASLLGGIASIAPFIGLLGTVWGIMQTLIALGAHSQLNFQMIAAPLGEALLMTAGGLFVAIPAAAAYRVTVHFSAMDRKAALTQLQASLIAHPNAAGVNP